MRVLPAIRAESIKLEPQTRINVDFKPNKKMRKRRELDALVNGKNRRMITTSTKKGQHELLRSVDEDEESESSEEVEFSLAAQNKSVIRTKRTPCWPGTGYIPLCAFILVLLCLLVCGGLVWFLYELHKEVGSLRSDITTVQSSNQAIPDQFQSMHTNLQDVENKVQGKKGIAYLNSQVDFILKQVTFLTKTTADLGKGQAAADSLHDVPNKVEEITKNVASLGSTVQSLETDLADLKSFRTQIQKQYDALRADVTAIETRLSSSTTPAPRSSDNSVDQSQPTDSGVASRLSDAVNDMNTTLRSVNDRLSQMETKMSNKTNLGTSDNVDVQLAVDKSMVDYKQAHEKDIHRLEQRIDSVNASLISVSGSLINVQGQLADYHGVSNVTPPSKTGNTQETNAGDAEGKPTESSEAMPVTDMPTSIDATGEPQLPPSEAGDGSYRRPRSAHKRFRSFV